jgi:hypothetical protein
MVTLMTQNLTEVMKGQSRRQSLVVLPLLLLPYLLM